MTAKEDFSWTNEAKNLKEGLPLNNKRKQPMNKNPEIVYIKLDRTSLPKDGQSVYFQTQNEEWHQGYFIGGDDLFWINESKWYTAFDIVSWKSN